MHSNLKNNSGISTFNLQLNEISLKLASAHFIPPPGKKNLKQCSRKQTV